MTDDFDLRRARSAITTGLREARMARKRESYDTGIFEAIEDLTGGMELKESDVSNRIRSWGAGSLGEHYKGYLAVLGMTPDEKATLTGRPVTDFAPMEETA